MQLNSWNEVIKWVGSRIAIPSDNGDYKVLSRGDSHVNGKTEHALQTYERVLHNDNSYKIIAEYATCPKCRAFWRSSITALNHQTNEAYTKHFAKGGESI